MAGHLADFGCNLFSKADESVDSRSDGRSTLGQHLQAGQAGLYPLNAEVELLYVSREFLAQRQRRGILQMGPANLDEALPLVGLLLEGVAQADQGGEQRLLKVEDGGDVHDGGEGVVGGCGHVDVVVGVDGLLAAHGAAEDLNGAVGDDFVGVHVGLGARARLPDDEGEVVDELEGGDLVSGLLDGLAQLGVCMALASSGGGGADGVPRPYFMLTVAAAPFKMPKARTMGGGMRSWGWLILKFSSERSVWAPQYLSAGTWISPKASDSALVLAMVEVTLNRRVWRQRWVLKGEELAGVRGHEGPALACASRRSAPASAGRRLRRALRNMAGRWCRW